jgi:hypothetical protein
MEMLYLPRELHEWYLRRRLDLNTTMYEMLKKILYEYALMNGFVHQHRYKETRVPDEQYQWRIETRCVVCNEKR